MIFMDKMGHMISDHSLQELHLFANKLGLKKEWFQDKPGHPHYDLTTPNARARAEVAGAILVDGREIVRILRRKSENHCWDCRHRTKSEEEKPCNGCYKGDKHELDI